MRTWLNNIKSVCVVLFFFSETDKTRGDWIIFRSIGFDMMEEFLFVVVLDLVSIGWDGGKIRGTGRRVCA